MTDELTAAQRAALDAIKASRDPCPSAETLIEYEALGGGDRARHAAHEHIQICSRCQLVLLHAAEPVAHASSIRWALPLAAILVLAVSVTLVWRAGALAPASPAVDTVRGTELQATSPIGSVDTVTQFSWQSPIGAARYRITVRRGADQIWQRETTGLQIDAPAGVFESGVDYQWIVEAIDREGDVRMTSPPQSFTYSRRR